MSAFKHSAVSFGTSDTPPPEAGRNIGPISLHNAIDATSDDPPALPWGEAYRYVGQMLSKEKLSREDRLVTGLQLCKLLKRLRQRGSLEWTATNRLPDDEAPKRNVVDQERAAELCGVSRRTIKSVENFYEAP